MNKDVRFPKDFLQTFIECILQLEHKISSWGKYTNVFTDFYLLSRIFAHFGKDKDKITRSPKGCPIVGKNNYVTPKYIVIYAGNAHIINVKNFLKTMFDSKTLYTSDSIDQNQVGDRADAESDKKIKLKELITARNRTPPQNIDELINEFLN